MDITRRDFLKISGAATAGLMLGSLLDLRPIKAYASANPPEWITEVPSICPYCGCGCGVIVGSEGNTITYVQGDPDHPINQGSLCSKGQASGQLNHVEGMDNSGHPYKAVDSERVIKPLYRGPGDADWTVIPWSQAISEIAQKIKDIRDTDIIVEEDGVPMKRLETIAALGTAKDTNEECYLFTKLMRALGIVYLEHCARV